LDSRKASIINQHANAVNELSQFVARNILLAAINRSQCRVQFSE
jgi:hypothetical protein